MTSGAGAEKYPHVFEPIRIGPVEVANRIYLPPHGVRLETPATSIGTMVPSEAFAHYYAERAAGGVGLLFHSTQVHPVARQPMLGSTPWAPEAIGSYARVADHVHAEGGKIMAQLWYAAFLEKLWEELGPYHPIFSASTTQRGDSPSTFYALPKDGIKLLIDAHAQCTRNLRIAGYDGVEINAAHGCIFEHFMSPYFNGRDDEYGGSLENRMRLLVEALEAIRSEAGPSMAVGFRLNATEMLPGGYDEDDCKDMVAYIAATGLADFVDIDIAVEPMQLDLMTTTFLYPKHHNRDRLAKVSPAAKPMVSLGSPGRLTSIADAEDMLANGVSDMIGAVRGLIAEPNLVKHAREGREHESRTCLAINFCVGGSNGLGCAINPATGREAKWGTRTVASSPRRMKVVIVGSGPAGLEAARVAAQRDHEVVVLERQDYIGGNLVLWSKLPGREHIANAVAWYEGRLGELGVKVQTGVEADVDTVLGHEPDVVITATGALYSPEGLRGTGTAVSPIPGSDRDFVITAEPLLRGEVEASGKVVVYDGDNMCGTGVAELLAQRGHAVELVTAPGGLMMGFGPGISGTGIPGVFPRLFAAGVQLGSATLKGIGDHTVTLVDQAMQERTVDDVGTVVLATRRHPVNSLAAALDGRASPLYVIGDALAPRGLPEATYEGHRFARLIGEDSMPASAVEEMFRPLDPVLPAVTAPAPVS